MILPDLTAPPPSELAGLASGQANKRKKTDDPSVAGADTQPMPGQEAETRARQHTPCTQTLTPQPAVLSFDLPKELVERHWAAYEGKALIGWFAGRWPSIPQVYKWSERVWKSLGLQHWTINWLGRGFLLFNFQTQADCLKVMAGGPWFLGPNACVLQKWRPFFDPNNPGPMLRPVWIRIKGLPFELWSSSCFQILGNAIGEYVCTSRASLAGGYGMDARICVAIDTSKALAPTITMYTNGIAKLLDLDYEGIPFRCFICKNTGHTAKDCPKVEKTEREQTGKKTTMKWIKKSELYSEGRYRIVRNAMPGPFDKIYLSNGEKKGGSGPPPASALGSPSPITPATDSLGSQMVALPVEFKGRAANPPQVDSEGFQKVEKKRRGRPPKAPSPSTAPGSTLLSFEGFCTSSQTKDNDKRMGLDTDRGVHLNAPLPLEDWTPGLPEASKERREDTPLPPHVNADTIMEL